MLDGLEISQFTYFQQCGGFDLDLVPAELTYGLERIVRVLAERRQRLRHRVGARISIQRRSPQGRTAIFEIQLRAGRRGHALALFDLHEKECQRLIKLTGVVLPAYDQVLKCSHIFNLLDSRGAISVTERVGVIGRVRRLALECGRSVDGRDRAQKLRRSREPALSARNRNRRDSRLDDCSCIESTCRICFKRCSISRR